MLTLLNFAEAVAIDWAKVGIGVAIMAGAALLLSILIVVISIFTKVDEDPRIKEVDELLAGANCGACGFPGCSGFAKALVEGKADLSQCGQTTAHNKIEIGNILGKTVDGNAEPTVAVVACNGGNQCADKYAYQGYGDCISQNMLAGGRKACETGCMGSGSCVNVCPYNSIKLTDGKAVVDPDLCRSCGLCIKTCPKTLIKRVPQSAKVYVACSTNCRGKDVTSKCKAGCISCGICEKNCPTGAIVLVNNVPIIDYSKCINCETCLLKCPRKVIKHVHPQDNVQQPTTPTVQAQPKPTAVESKSVEQSAVAPKVDTTVATKTLETAQPKATVSATDTKSAQNRPKTTTTKTATNTTKPSSTKSTKTTNSTKK